MLYKIRFFIAILVFLMAIVGLLGIFYPLPIFDVQIAPLIQKVIIDFTVIAFITLFLIILLTLLFGRIYCSVLCPFGIFQEFIALLRGKNKEKTRANLPIKYFISAITFGALIGGSVLIIRYIEPYTYFGSVVTLSIIGIVAAIIILILTLSKNRYFCTNICPVGCILGLISKVSLLKIHIKKEDCVSCRKCEKNCPSGCISIDTQNIENETCIKCLKCIGLCPKKAIKYSVKPKQEIIFSPKRRELLIAGSALVILIGALKAGYELSKNMARNVRNVILPPGAMNANRMYNKCLNCNLCVKACPNKILKKADNNFGAIHTDYNEGEKFCKFDCIECSKVCPSGAIKKLSVEEKQRTRIAMAVINPEKCTKCGICVSECPTGAITKEENKNAIVDASKCIGCGKCKKHCPASAIEIFAINEQQRV